jgi:P-type E1-E2 ATPase
VLGDHAEAVLLLASIAFIIGIELYQERRTEHTLEALRDFSSPRALVIRDAEQRRIAGREVVRDDIVVLGEGDRVPADAILLAATNLSTDESLLTGESVPVRKVARPPRQLTGAEAWRSHMCRATPRVGTTCQCASYRRAFTRMSSRTSSRHARAFRPPITRPSGTPKKRIPSRSRKSPGRRPAVR